VDACTTPGPFRLPLADAIVGESGGGGGDYDQIMLRGFCMSRSNSFNDKGRMPLNPRALLTLTHDPLLQFLYELQLVPHPTITPFLFQDHIRN
jgi:hypothetical protein